MSDSYLTKQALDNSLKGLMVKEAFNNISVKDIVDDCGLTRQVFYYLFKDKYDLMNWIYYTEAARIMTSYNKVEHWMNSLTNLCNYMRQNKAFYINALNTTGQNSFQEFLHDYVRDISISVIENTQNAGFEEDKMGIYYLIYFHCFCWFDRAMG